MTSVVHAGSPSTDDPPAPVQGNGEVIAQGLVDLGAGEHQWRLANTDVGATATALPAATPTLLLVLAGDEVLADGSDGARSLLAPGEAAFQPAASSSNLVAQGAGSARVAGITLDIAAEGGLGVPFAPGEGTHDLELLRSTLGATETLELITTAPALVFVTAGAITLADGTPLAAGGTAVVVGEIALTATGDVPATVVVAMIGPVLGSTDANASTTIAPVATAPASATTAAGPATSAPATATTPPATAPPATNPPAPTPTTPTTPPTAPPTAPPTNPPPTNPPPTNPPPTDPPPPTDSDGDGLSDIEESGIGTDPYNTDSDGDDYGDGAEVNAGTNPLDINSHP